MTRIPMKTRRKSPAKGKRKAKVKRSPIDNYRDISARIVAMIEQAEASGDRWQLPWHRVAQGGRAVNATTGHVYRGINSLLLGFETIERGYSSPRWATKKQWEDAGSPVKPGETGMPVTFFMMWEKQGDEASGEDGDTRKIPMLRLTTAYNADQVENPPAPITEGRADLTARLAIADAAVKATGANIAHRGDAACYVPKFDQILMPPRELFRDTDTSTATENYYSTLLHELTHWTGAAKRLARVKGAQFGDPEYAFEELVAEMGAAFLCADLGVTCEPRPDHARYMASWKKKLTDDPRAIFRAAKLAEQAAEYVQNCEAQPDPDPVTTAPDAKPVPAMLPLPAPAARPEAAPARLPGAGAAFTDLSDLLADMEAAMARDEAGRQAFRDLYERMETLHAEAQEAEARAREAERQLEAAASYADEAEDQLMDARDLLTGRRDDRAVIQYRLEDFMARPQSAADFLPA